MLPETFPHKYCPLVAVLILVAPSLFNNIRVKAIGVVQNATLLGSQVLESWGEVVPLERGRSPYFYYLWWC